MYKKTTLRDVAKIAGVSTQTVSRVINDHPDVSDETRLKIQDIINDLGYSPNIIARSLSRGKTNTLGIVGFRLDFFGSSSVLMAVERKARELGFSMLLTLLNEIDDLDVDFILENLVSRQVDGLIWTVPGKLDEANFIMQKTRELPIPVVILNHNPDERHNFVCLDNCYGGKIATQHLLDEGYRQVGIITGPSGWWESEERAKGWREALGYADPWSVPADLVEEGDWSSQSGEKAFNNLIEKNPQINAVFACNDQMALGAYRAAQKRGMDIPSDIGLIGFDNIPEAAFFTPPLSSVNQNCWDLGAGAVTRLMELLKNPKAEKGSVIWVKPQLVVRESSLRKDHSLA